MQPNMGTIVAKTRALVRGLQVAQALKQKTLGSNQANEVAAQSPLLASVGGPGAVANPAAGQRMSQMIAAANAIKKLTAEPKEEETLTQPQKVTKANGNVQLDNEPFPASSYSHLPSDQAAAKITENAHSAGLVKYASSFRASTQRRIDGERQAMAQIAREAPGVPVAEITARLEGVPNQTTAKAFREHLKQQYPQAAASFDKHLSDDVIKTLWRKKG
jgi:hypothetical protein